MHVLIANCWTVPDVFTGPATPPVSSITLSTIIFLPIFQHLCDIRNRPKLIKEPCTRWSVACPPAARVPRECHSAEKVMNSCGLIDSPPRGARISNSAQQVQHSVLGLVPQRNRPLSGSATPSGTPGSRHLPMRRRKPAVERLDRICPEPPRFAC
jgi:hypothetical protein